MVRAKNRVKIKARAKISARANESWARVRVNTRVLRKARFRRRASLIILGYCQREKYA